MKTAVELFAQRLIQRGIGYNINDFEEAKEMEKEREKTVFSIAYRMTPIEFGKEYCESEFEKFNKTFKQKP
jgi:hypothetical protein